MDNQKPRKGRCTNFLNCPLADNENVQEVQPGNDFKCSHCGLDLEEIIDKPNHRLLWLLIATAVVAAIVLFSVQKCCHKNDKIIISNCGDTIVLKGDDTISIRYNNITTYNDNGDTIIQNGCGDTISIKKFKKVEQKPKIKGEEPPIKKPEPPVEKPKPSRDSPAYGRYYGARDEKGEPNGIGGRVEVTTEYHWGNHVFSPGDVIENTTFEHGVLRHGRVRKNGGIIEF